MKIYILVLFFLTLNLNVFSQNKIIVNEKTKDFINGNHNALVVNIYEAGDDLILKEWKRLMKDYKAKVSSKNEIFADDAFIKKLSPNTVDIYAFTEKNSDGDNNLVVAFDLGGAFLSSSQHSDKYRTAENILYEFAVYTTKEAIKEQFKEEEHNLSKLQKEQQSFEREKEKLLKDIEDYKDRIVKAEEDIKTNAKNQELKKDEILKQQKYITEIKEKQSNIK
ncbi:MAG: hypothetical protein A2046_03390 [Bacteroidetes bacterium GWA2_30_7]|nr:MAG: hypothetical protein A2046_03390 [Bacteroidetes bacterium GWA2_30_7]